MKPLRLLGVAALAPLFFVSLLMPPAARAASKPSAPSLRDSITASCTILLDAKTGEWLRREGDCMTRRAPMSSFKLPLAVMGYDAGILIDSARPAWPYREGYWAFRDEERQVINPKTWESISVLWYSREITRRLGEKKFADYVKRFGYGNQDVTGDSGKKNGLERSWLSESSLRISPVEQALFVRRLLMRELGVSREAYAKTEAIIPRFETANGWKVQGKTGSGSRPGRVRVQGPPGGFVDASIPFGWFVGWAEKDGARVVFVKWIEGSFRGFGGPNARDLLLAEWPTLSPPPGR